MLISVLANFSIADKAPRTWAVWGEKHLFHFHFHTLAQTSKEVRADTQDRNTDVGTEAEATVERCALPCSFWLTLSMPHKLASRGTHLFRVINSDPEMFLGKFYLFFYYLKVKLTLMFNGKRILKKNGYQDTLVGKGTSCQACHLEFDPWNFLSGGRELAPTDCPLTSMHICCDTHHPQ